LALSSNTIEIENIDTYSNQFIVQSGAFLSVRELLLGMIEEAGFDPKTAYRVVQCESGWNPNAIGDSGKSWGLWQIHQPSHNLGPASFDPILSTEYAIKLLRSSRSWEHWSCY